MTIIVQKECLLKAARAFLVFRAVEEHGEILVYRPSSQDIEDEKFDLDFSFYIASNEELEKIIAAAKNVSEIEDAVGEEITDFSTQVEEKKEETKPAVASSETKPAQKKEDHKKTGTPAKKAERKSKRNSNN